MDINVEDKVYVVLRGTHMNFTLDQCGTVVAGTVVAILPDTYGIRLNTITKENIIIEVNFLNVYSNPGDAFNRLKDFLVPITREKEVTNG